MTVDGDANVSPDARRVLRAARWPVVIVLAVVTTAVVLTLASSTGGTPLDPESPGPKGGRALSQVLQRQGVVVDPVNTSADAEVTGSTVVVTQAHLVREETVQALGDEAERVVLVGPDEQLVEQVAPGVTTAGEQGLRTRSPGCDLPAASAAGPATLGGAAYQGGHSCYDGSLVRSGNVVMLGSHTPLSNEALDEEGNAALAMRLLGQHQRIVWYTPSGEDPGLRGGEESLSDLLPRGWTFAFVQLGGAAVLFALWRARRLGRVVTEPLPVVVRAVETVEGRARLYRRGDSTQHAAEALRAATRERLLPILGLGAEAQPQAVVSAIASRTGRNAHQVLYGPPPADTAELIRLADALDELEREVGR